MGVWTELVGVRKDLRLKSKWWHHAAVGGAVLSCVIVYFTVAIMVASRPYKLTTANTYSLTLLHHAMGRQQTTTLADLYALSGVVGSVGENGDLVPLKRASAPATIRCEARAQYKATDTVKVGDAIYRSIPDYPGQDADQPRHCIAAPEYASAVAEAVAVYIPDGTGKRKQDLRGFLVGITAIIVWLILYWNVYYRGVVAIYAKRRERRRRARFEHANAR